MTTEQALRVKVGTQLVPFSRDHLLLSIFDSLRHRPTATADASGLTATAMSKIMRVAQQGVISRDELVRQTLQILKRFDRAAAMHYAAFHPLRT